jgi:glyoxylase-like metal-dependent hydrolase (beta-lactamase superfamily II)/ferredoxin
VPLWRGFALAQRKESVTENIPGDFFVDSTCIDCDACRQSAPAVFADAGGHSYVARQPLSAAERREAFQALVACPTASIGSADRTGPRAAAADFPLEIEDGVYYCGFNSEKSYGGNSYFVRRDSGNWMIDSPRFAEPLVRAIQKLGGIRHLFLTHRDDVADAAKWAARFGAERIIHRHELRSQPDAERVIDGDNAVQLEPGFLAIPTPGHTRGHCVLLQEDRFLFTGDHLWWDREEARLGAGREVCWWDWPHQVESMARLADYRFEWVLPGHGQRVKLPAERMRTEIEALVLRMKP